MDAFITNHAPDGDALAIEFKIHPESEATWVVTVWRDEDLEVHVNIQDGQDGSSTDLVLGKPGETQKL